MQAAQVRARDDRVERLQQLVQAHNLILERREPRRDHAEVAHALSLRRIRLVEIALLADVPLNHAVKPPHAAADVLPGTLQPLLQLERGLRIVALGALLRARQLRFVVRELQKQADAFRERCEDALERHLLDGLARVRAVLRQLNNPALVAQRVLGVRLHHLALHRRREVRQQLGVVLVAPNHPVQNLRHELHLVRDADAALAVVVRLPLHAVVSELAGVAGVGDDLVAGGDDPHASLIPFPRVARGVWLRGLDGFAGLARLRARLRRRRSLLRPLPLKPLQLRLWHQRPKLPHPHVLHPLRQLAQLRGRHVLLRPGCRRGLARVGLQHALHGHGVERCAAARHLRDVEQRLLLFADAVQPRLGLAARLHVVVHLPRRDVLEGE